MESSEFAHLLIKEYTHWQLYLCDQQNYLGRSYLWAKRNDDVDLLEMTKEERDEFFEVAAKLKVALNDLYHPRRLNYAALSNEAHHLHVHVIPRYDEDREIDGVVFHDGNKGGAPWPSDKNFKISDTLLQKIKNEIVAKLA